MKKLKWRILPNYGSGAEFHAVASARPDPYVIVQNVPGDPFILGVNDFNRPGHTKELGRYGSLTAAKSAADQHWNASGAVSENPLTRNRGIAEFSHYVVAVKKRMINHFGIRATAAAAVVDSSKRQLQKWFSSGVPADTAARYLDTAGFAYASNPIANPISHETWLWLAAAGSAALGVAFLAQSTSLVNAPTPVETAPPALPAGTSNEETLGPLGAQTPSVSV